MERKSTNNLYKRLQRIIEKAKPGERLPSEPALSKELNVSRASLREAMRALENEGWIRRRQGVGTFALHPKKIIESGLEVLESIETLAERIGLPVSMGLLKIERCIAKDSIAKKLDIPKNNEVTCVTRVINVESSPVAFLEDILPIDILLEEDIPVGFSGSILDLLIKRGKPMLGNSKCEIKAITADDLIANALDIQRDDALLQFTSILYSVYGRPVDYSKSYFLPGYFRFHVVRNISSTNKLKQ
ncbi:MAG TPA: GntR family transcriptional regulator [Anaerolineae bacterium]|nr:GntR family transcriptional regulator [Anaerolineae bacterium]